MSLHSYGFNASVDRRSMWIVWALQFFQVSTSGLSMGRGDPSKRTLDEHRHGFPEVPKRRFGWMTSMHPPVHGQRLDTSALLRRRKPNKSEPPKIFSYVTILKLHWIRISDYLEFSCVNDACMQQHLECEIELSIWISIPQPFFLAP